MSSVLVRLRSARRSAPALPGGQVVPEDVLKVPAAVAAAALDPGHWHSGDPRWASAVAATSAATGTAVAIAPSARAAVPSPRTAQGDTVIHLPADGALRLVGAGAAGPATGPAQAEGSSATPAHPDPSTWFS